METHTILAPEIITNRNFVGKRVVYSSSEDFLERNRDNLRGRVPDETMSTTPKDFK